MLDRPHKRIKALCLSRTWIWIPAWSFLTALVEAVKESIQDFGRHIFRLWIQRTIEGGHWGQTSGAAKISWNLTASMNSPWRQPSMIWIEKHHFEMIFPWLASTQPQRETKGDSKLINSELTDTPTIAIKVGAIIDFPITIEDPIESQPWGPWDSGVEDRK